MLMWLMNLDFAAGDSAAAVDPNDYGNLPSIDVERDTPETLRRKRNRRYRYLVNDS